MKLVILERDTVARFDATVPGGWQPLPGSLEALAHLHREGYRMLVTAQLPGIGRSQHSMDAVNRMHAGLLEAVRNKGGDIEAFFVCPHAPTENCRCRKPRPGLFEEIAERLKINLARVFIVGKTAADVEAARAAQSLPVLVRAGDVSSAAGEQLRGVPVFDDLPAFAAALLGGQLTNA
jgi:D-glycero-D-manno-heptose 1,7-bisphosphate phosphatase